MQKIVKRTILLLLILSVVMIGKVYAEGNYQVKVIPSKASAYKGDSLTVTLKLTNITVTPGIGAIQGKIIYDQAIFEKVTSVDIQNGAGWGSVVYNADASTGNEGSFTVERQAADTIKTDNDLFTITFKILDAAKLGKTQIRITDLVASNGEADFEVGEQIGELTVAQTPSTPTTPTPTPTPSNPATPTPTPTPSNPATPTPTPTPSNTATPTPTPTPSNPATQTNTTSNEVSLPYAGEENIYKVIIAVSIVAIVVAVISYKKLKDTSLK